MHRALILLLILTLHVKGSELWCFEGDSTTAYNENTLDTWVFQVTNYPRFSFVTNTAAGGSTTATMFSRYTNSVQVNKPSAGQTNYLVIKIGVNDVLTGVDWHTSLSNWNNEVSCAVRDGFKVINFQTQKNNGMTDHSDQMNNLTNFNSAMLANGSVLIQMNSESFGLTNYADAAYFYDGLHPTVLNDTITASNFNSIVTAFGFQGTMVTASLSGGPISGGTIRTQ